MKSAMRAAACLPLVVLVACTTTAVPEKRPPVTAPAAREASPAHREAAADPVAASKSANTGDAAPAADVKAAPATDAVPATDPMVTSSPAASESAKPKPAIEPTPKPARAARPQAVAPEKPVAKKPTALPAAATPARQTKVAPPPAPSPAPAAASITGRLELVSGNRQKVAPGEAADGVVYFLPKAGAPRPKPRRFTIDTRSRGFTPALLVIPAGSTVSFPNKDTILHNVFSRTPGTMFDFGFYGPGETRNQVFAKPGLVIVNCNVHHTMRANVLVLETPHYVRPDKAGRFELKQLPPGPGTLVFWHPRSRAQTVAITGPTAPVMRRLTADKPRLDAHMQTAR